MPATWIETREVALDELERFPGNARVGNKAEIRKSLIANGQYRSVVIRQTDDGRLVILAGNNTFDAMRDLAAKPPTLQALLALFPEDERPMYQESAEFWLDQISRKVLRGEIIRCTDREARKINLVDNRANDLATDDKDALVELLSYLDGDYEGTGFSAEDVEKLIDPGDMPDPGDADTDPGLDRWGVIVECDSERDQVRLLERLGGEGWTVRALIA